jgi:hypothetical protein
VAHVELSLSESFVPQPRQPDPAVPSAGDGAVPQPATCPADGLEKWAATVATAAEPCLVIDKGAMIIAASASCHRLLGLGPTGAAVGRFLVDGVIRLVDFTAARGQLAETEVDKIPPLLALSSGRLVRGLMRVHDGGELDATVDAISAPLYEGANVAGTLTFFSAI